jgi:hypothetical protein
MEILLQEVELGPQVLLLPYICVGIIYNDLLFCESLRILDLEITNMLHLLINVNDPSEIILNLLLYPMYPTG